MVTYLVKSTVLNLHKIGRTENIKKRLIALKSESKDKNLEVIKTFKGDCENYFHKMFHSKRIKGEWFDLKEDDISFMLKHKPTTVENILGVYAKILKDRNLRIKIGEDIGVSEITISRWLKNGSDKMKSKMFNKVVSQYLNTSK